MELLNESERNVRELTKKENVSFFFFLYHVNNNDDNDMYVDIKIINMLSTI